MFIKREDLVDMLEVIDCDNGYVDLDHLIECCNNLPSSGMSVWCMKCENNGECMSIDKPNCFQPRQADTPQTERPSDDDETIQAIYHLQKVGWLQEHDRILTDTPQTDMPEYAEWKDAYNKMTDCGWK